MFGAMQLKWVKPKLINPLIEMAMHPDVTYFIILLCLTPDNFTHQGESAGTQWVKPCHVLYLP
jgi:hypothetical protein